MYYLPPAPTGKRGRSTSYGMHEVSYGEESYALWKAVGSEASVISSIATAAHMTAFRWSLWEKLKDVIPDGVTMHMTYGAAAKAARRVRSIPKSHSNDAYAMGRLHPKKRARTMHFQKCRRNNRILEKFYDTQYTDLRDGKEKSGSELSCSRTIKK